MSLHVYNSLTKSKEPVTLINKNIVTMYHCGPTVYDRVHIGNLRSFLLGDILRRYYEFKNIPVKQVMNITDIGHLSGDSDHGDDKMMKLLKRKDLEVSLENMLSACAEIIYEFKGDLLKLNILTPHHMPRASEYITQQIELIKILIEKNYTYTLSDGIYFDTSKYELYGALGDASGGKDGELHERITHIQKHNRKDFALWKFNSDHGFESELGKGFPGWHIECSAMSTALLGNEFDFHTGGMDLKMIHHNNEIAQSCAAYGGNFCNYWMHGEFLNVASEKMSKSFGNMYNLGDIINQGVSPMALRMLFLQTHYRSVMDFSFESLEATTHLLSGLYKIISKYVFLHGSFDTQTINTLRTIHQDITAAYEDDLNTALAFSLMMKHHDIEVTQKVELLLAFDELFGLGFSTVHKVSQDTFSQHAVKDLITQRKLARELKNYRESDRLRDELLKHNISVNDGKDESVYFIKHIFGVTLE